MDLPRFRTPRRDQARAQALLALSEVVGGARALEIVTEGGPISTCGRGSPRPIYSADNPSLTGCRSDDLGFDYFQRCTKGAPIYKDHQITRGAAG
jgi:hypothetical protein